jgi:hypothetical protein
LEKIEGAEAKTEDAEDEEGFPIEEKIAGDLAEDFEGEDGVIHNHVSIKTFLRGKLNQEITRLWT